LGVEVLVKVSVREKKRRQPKGEKKRNDSGGRPKPPFAPLDPPEVGADIVGMRACSTADRF